MATRFDLLVVGDANPDVVLVDAPRRPAFGQREELVRHGELALGGSAAIMACGAARLGLRTAFAGRVGDDAAGRFVLDALTRRGVDVSACTVDPSRPTGLTVILNEGGDRAILTALGTLPEMTAEDVPATVLEGVRHVHAASYFLQPGLAAGLPGLFAAARAAGATTSLDTNDDPSGRWDGLDAVLAMTDVLLPNEAEARAIAGTDDLAEAARMLASRGPLPVIKCGAAGALAWDGEPVRAAPMPAEPLDTVGAGDSFDAGLLAGRLRGLGLPDSLAVAAAAGALSTRAYGGTAAQPTWKEAAAAARLPERTVR
ncbi:carbohydrate kinase family protein [Actinomadura sp. BRA 177]|uniref:carbohydrate kinase family protein n=1 Tax=Actinomadura sp. BRA 177 TaxID=2745202 RepID=UPI001596208F|nr:carbohydrate kinase family protein [Actinomadura sp. BRA 177]NVI91605.1 carbohydrate kinase family protein [Actinomadura sp. BRA 177]